jgi:hypothetical protein
MTSLAIIRRAMQRALQWRLLLVSPVVLLVAVAATLIPLSRFLGELFDHSTRWQALSEALDSPALAGLIKALMTPAAGGLVPALETSAVLALVFAPLLAGAALTVARTDARLRIAPLLSGAAEAYPRLLRMQIAAIVPLAIAGFAAAMVFGWSSHVSDHVTTEAASHTSRRVAWLVSVVAVFLAQLVIDAGRARLVAEPGRRSAVVALWAGVRLVVKQPGRTLLLSASSTVIALLVATVLLVVRQQLAQSSTLAVLVAFAVGQLAVVAIAWGHAARLCGLVEIVRDLAPRHAEAVTDAEPEPAPPPAE